MTTIGSEVPPPKPSATLILVGEKRKRLQVYLVKRGAKSSFMAGLYVFPGGTPTDRTGTRLSGATTAT